MVIAIVRIHLSAAAPARALLATGKFSSPQTFEESENPSIFGPALSGEVRGLLPGGSLGPRAVEGGFRFEKQARPHP